MTFRLLVATFLLVFSIAVMFPEAANAQGFVPCTGEVGDECQFCKLVDLMDNVIDWLVLIFGIIAAIIIVVAGATLATSAGNVSAKEWARRMIYNMLVGFVLVLAGWLLIDYVIKILVSEDGKLPDFGPWHEIECVEQPRSRTYDTVGGGVHVTGTSTAFNPTGNGSCETISSGACSESNLSSVFGNSTVGSQASQVCNGESAGFVQSESRTDRISTGEAFSFGLFQINVTVHDLHGCGPGGSTLNCTDAFSGRNYDATIVDQDLYDQCAAAAKSASCNLNNAKRIYDGRAARQPSNPWADWSAAKVCGLAS